MAQDFIKQTKRDDNAVKKELGFGKKVHTYRYKKLRLPVDKEQVMANNVVAAKDTAKILDFIDWNLGGSYLAKRDLMVVDLIANNNWERPIYFSITVGNSKSSYFWLTDYFRLEGLAYRFVPIKNPVSGNSYEYGIVDTDIMYDNFMNKYTWGNMEVDGVYLDETNRRLSYNMRNISGRLAKELVKRDKKRNKMIEMMHIYELFVAVGNDMTNYLSAFIQENNNDDESIINHQLSIINHQLSIINRHL